MGEEDGCHGCFVRVMWQIQKNICMLVEKAGRPCDVMSRSPVTDTDIIYENMDTRTGHRKTIPFEEDLIRQEQDTKNHII